MGIFIVKITIYFADIIKFLIDFFLTINCCKKGIGKIGELKIGLFRGSIP
jgi:hypothetical protein